MHQLFEEHKAPVIALLGLEVWLENKIHKQQRERIFLCGVGGREKTGNRSSSEHQVTDSDPQGTDSDPQGTGEFTF